MSRIDFIDYVGLPIRSLTSDEVKIFNKTLICLKALTKQFQIWVPKAPEPKEDSWTLQLNTD